MSLRYRLISTPLGFAGIVGSTAGLRRVYLPERSRDVLLRAIKTEFAVATEDRSLLPRLAGNLRRYFEGHEVKFDVKLDCAGAPRFRVAVWQACRRVGYGRTLSYGELAAKAGRPGAARAVGSAMSHNPFPIVVPCHRVLASGGGPGGWSGPPGQKQRLLALEQAARE